MGGVFHRLALYSTWIIMNCKNCEQIVDGNFCTHCGQSARVERINLSNFLNELSAGVFQIDKGFFYSLIELFVRPGPGIREYLAGKRKNHFKPIAYVLTMSALYFLLSRALGSETFLSDFVKGFSNGGSGSKVDAGQLATLNWFANNYAYAILLLLPLYSLASYLAFRGAGFNYLEHFVLNSYITGQQAALYSLSSVLSLMGGNEGLWVLITLCISVSYAFLVFWQFFSEQGRLAIVLRSLLTYAISLVFILLALIILFAGVR